MHNVGEFLPIGHVMTKDRTWAGVDHFVDHRSAVVIRDIVACDLSVGSDTGTMGCRIGLL